MNEEQPNTESRRRFLKIAAGTTAVAAVASVSGLFPRVARAQDLPHLKLSDPMAKALQYVHDASKSDSPKRKPGDDCSNCQFYHGKPGEEWGPCDLFPGKAVHSKGWCVSHAVKA